jgi:hypothetical protein
MTAFIPVNLSQSLSSDELRQLTALAERERKPLESIILGALKDLAAKVTPGKATPAEVAA